MRPRVHVPGMGAGIPLGGDAPVPSVAQVPQRTDYHTNFQGCQIGLYCLLDEEGICKGYRLRITDPWSNHVYDLDVGQEVKDEWKKDLGMFPDVGEKAEGHVSN